MVTINVDAIVRMTHAVLPGMIERRVIFLLFVQRAHKVGISCLPSRNSRLILNLGADSLADACNILGHQIICHRSPVHLQKKSRHIT